MQYREFQPDATFSRHVECFWELRLHPADLKPEYELLAPDCSFDVIFCTQPFSLFFVGKNLCERIPAGAVFVGQKTSGAYFGISKPQTIFGIRFKPFAFAHLFPFPPDQLTNKVRPLEKLFPTSRAGQQLITSILGEQDIEDRIDRSQELILALFKDLFYIDQTFRAQINYIMDRKGCLKVRDLFSEFAVSKVTLNKHFIAKMGLSPKQVSRIWRLNHFLQLHQRLLGRNLTSLALEAGYYDQAHFIREFKSFFKHRPKQVLQQNNQLLSISQGIIDRRFSNAYDPRI